MKKPKDFKQTFKGRCKLYLNDKTPEAQAARTEYYGEWLTKRKDIFCKNRKFKAVIYIKSKCGQTLEPLSCVFLSTGDDWHLSQTIYQQSIKYIDEWLEVDKTIRVDTNNSYAVVKV